MGRLLILLLVVTGTLRAQEHPTLTAIPAPDGMLHLDGRLEEAAWHRASVADGFRQVEPVEGAAVGQATTTRVLFDRSALWVGFFCWDTLGVAGLRAPDLTRDFDYFNNDHVSVVLDPFGDRRVAYAFQVTPYGALRDLVVQNGDTYNRDWTGVWDARTTRTDTGWVAEIRIPWATLRYPSAAGEVASWVANFSRNNRRINELSAWAAWPRNFTAYHLQYAGTLAGLQPPPPGLNLSVQPYVLARATRPGEGAWRDDLGYTVGGDVKWAITPTTVLDLTANTDFAQVEADAGVVRLDRFSIFLPEKRPFFLEGAESFSVGSSFFTPFYSRRIGLDDENAAVPINVGARLVARSATQQGGLLLLHQGGRDDDAFLGAGRYARYVGAHRFGGLLTFRHDTAPGITNATATLEADLRFSSVSAASTFFSASHTGGGPARTNGWAGYAWLRTTPSWGYLGHIIDVASAKYDAQMGFLFERDILYNSPALNLDLRPRWLPSAVRALTPGFVGNVYQRLSTGRVFQANVSLRPLALSFQSGASAQLTIDPAWEEVDSLTATFFAPLGLRLEPGTFPTVRAFVSGNTDYSRRAYADISIGTGSYYDGHLTSLAVTGALAPVPQATLLLRYAFNRATQIGPSQAAATVHLLEPTLRLALNARLNANVRYQYDTQSEQSGWNVRLAWEFRPLSFVYLVFNDQRQLGPITQPMTVPPLQQAVLKMTYLQAF